MKTKRSHESADDKIRKASRDRVERFFRARKADETREYAWAILDFLADRAEQIEQSSSVRRSTNRLPNPVSINEWVRSKDLVQELVPHKIPHEITLFRLLDSLVEEELIDRRLDENYTGKGKKPVYYRLGVRFLSHHWAESREQLIDKVEKLERIRITQYLKYAIALDFLKSQIDDPESAVETEYKKILANPREPSSLDFLWRKSKPGEPVSDEEIGAYFDLWKELREY